MRKLVEDAGPSWCSGRLGMWHRLTGFTSGTATIGTRPLTWTWASGAVNVTHADAGGAAVSYPVATVTTPAPNGAARMWWGCPACARRVGRLYLPDGRDRLACRTCCGLGYASQYPNVRRGPIASAPTFTRTAEAGYLLGNGLVVTRRFVRCFPAKRSAHACGGKRPPADVPNR